MHNDIHGQIQVFLLLSSLCCCTGCGDSGNGGIAEPTDPYHHYVRSPWVTNSGDVWESSFFCNQHEYIIVPLRSMSFLPDPLGCLSGCNCFPQGAPPYEPNDNPDPGRCNQHWMPTDWGQLFSDTTDFPDSSSSSVIPRYCVEGECSDLEMTEGAMRWVYIMVHSSIEMIFMRLFPDFNRHWLFRDFLEQATGGPVSDAAAKILYEEALNKEGCPYLYIRRGSHRFFVRVECGFSQGTGDRSGDWFIKVYHSEEDADFLDGRTRSFSTCLPDCGDGLCDPTENCRTCPADCGSVCPPDVADPGPGCSEIWEIPS